MLIYLVGLELNVFILLMYCVIPDCDSAGFNKEIIMIEIIINTLHPYYSRQYIKLRRIRLNKVRSTSAFAQWSMHIGH